MTPLLFFLLPNPGFLIYVHTKTIKKNVLVFELLLEMSVAIDTFKMVRIFFNEKAFG